ncbi:unnamed protein product [Paramecium pentaurelia]|uniref:Uncharacterized protein n=1 Tax=Paramecium pentaurelia TaxID=43138 RepID=A0A8S1YGW0_9CILI|nr:unnamed protein product [Paramecium pentaurelia]
MSILQTDSEKISCKAHNNEYCVAADLNTKGQRDVNFLCIKCIIEQLSNKKITLIDDTKRLICEMKTQKIENQQKEKEKRYFLDIIKQIVTVDVAFDKMTSFIQQRLFYIQKEIESLQYEGKNNYLEDLTELSRIYSEEKFDNGIKIQEDNKIIEEIEKQFETLFNTPQYLQLNQTIKNTRSLLQETTEATVLIYLIQPSNEKLVYLLMTQKTPSLKKLCKIHKKEIIMFDADVESKIRKQRKNLCVYIV